MKISELSRNCGYEYYGNDCDINSIRFALASDKDSIAIVKRKQEINEINADCILIEPAFIDSKKTIIFAGDPIEVASVKIAKELLKFKGIPIFQKTKYTKEHNFYVGKNVKIGKDTFLSPNVYIENDVYIGNNCYIEPNVHIGPGTIIYDNVYIEFGSSIGAKSFYNYYDNEQWQEFPGLGKTIISFGVSIGSNSVIERGTFSDTIVGEGCKIGNLIEIGHDVLIGRNCKIVSQTAIASGSVIGDCVQIFGQTGIANNIRVGDNAVIYAKSGVTKNISAGQKISGMYAREHKEELRIQAKLRRL